MSRFLRQPADQPRREPRQSVYAGRFEAQPETVYMVQNGPNAGRIVGREVGGEFVEAGPCCSNPLRCEWPECWRPIGARQRREFHEALLDADTFEDLPGKWQAAILQAEESQPKLRVVSGD